MNKKNDSRRKLLKSFAAGSGTVVAGKSLPEAWMRPVVESLLLPAHAQTTDLVMSCGTLTEEQATGRDGGDIAILFDGGDCSLIEFDMAQDGLHPDSVIGFDTDLVVNLLWDDLGTGSNWIRDDTDIPGAEDNPNASYYVIVSKGGSTYHVSFTVIVSSDAAAGPPYASGNMTISNVEIVKQL